MEQIYESVYEVAPSACDVSGRLGYYGAFNVFMDAATAHAERLGVGLRAMGEKSLYWLTVRTKIVFLERPKMSECLRLLTWPEKPAALRCNRSYALLRGETPLLLGRTEWAVYNTEKQSVVPGAELFSGMEFDRGPACEESYARIPDRFTGAEPFGEYRVCSSDIDAGGHMNNTAYVRALLGAFSAKELSALNPHAIDVAYRTPCFEGDTLSFYKKETETGLDLRIAKGNETALLARISKG